MPSPRISPSRPLWVRLPQAVFAAAGLIFATCTIVAEIEYAKGAFGDGRTRDERLQYIKSAVRWYPPNHEFRNAVSYFHFMNRQKGSLPEAVEAHVVALESNPYAFDVRRNLASLYYEAGKKELAMEQIGIIKSRSPNANIVLIVNKNPSNN